MADYIDRQAAVEACRKNFVNKVFVADAVYNQGVENCLKRIKELQSAQPEVIRCKDCKWWDKYNETQGYCMAAKHGYYSRHWEIHIRRTYGEDFFCADAEPIEQEDKR